MTGQPFSPEKLQEGGQVMLPEKGDETKVYIPGTMKAADSQPKAAEKRPADSDGTQIYSAKKNVEQT